MKHLICIIILAGFCNAASPQRNCGSTNYNKAVVKNYPELAGRYGRTNTDPQLSDKLRRLAGVIDIPVIVHVVYNTNEQNLSKEVIKNQIEQLNLDYSARNNDIINVPTLFQNRIANFEIHFTLNSITRTHTEKTIFILKDFDTTAKGKKIYNPAYDPIKFTAQGGQDCSPYTQFLNIWIGNINKQGLNSQLLGYGTFPGGVGEYDGVVIYYKAFGTNKDIYYYPFNKGRTLTHEVGHWLNLIHIGGDREGGCGDDLIADTPPQEGGTNETGNGYGQNFGIPKHPLIYQHDCADQGEMFMNYMDYVNDSCMIMFSKDQKDRARSLFVEGGDRAYFLTASPPNHNLLFNDNFRSDNYTPNIIEFKKYFHCRPVTDTCRYAFVQWTKDVNIHSYKVQAKKVNSNAWDSIITPNSYIKIGGLNSHILYEVKVQAILDNGKYSAESTPYVFILRGSNPFKLKKLKLIE